MNSRQQEKGLNPFERFQAVGRDGEALVWKLTAGVQVRAQLPGLTVTFKGQQGWHVIYSRGSLLSPSDWQQRRQCKVGGRKTCLTQHGVKDSVLGCACRVYAAAAGRAHAMVRSPSVTMAASWTHGWHQCPHPPRCPEPQHPEQGLLWQVLSPDSEVWNTEGSEVWSEGSSSEHSFWDTLEVITSSWVLPHHFPIMPPPKETRAA